MAMEDMEEERDVGDENEEAKSEAEELKELAKLPAATGIPHVQPNETVLIEFAYNGERHSVLCRKPSWGKAKSLQRGMKVDRYEETIQGEDGEERVVPHQVMDPYSLAQQTDRLMDLYVLEVNGTPWGRGQNKETLDDQWLGKFMQKFAPYLSVNIAEARKKSKSQ